MIMGTLIVGLLLVVAVVVVVIDNFRAIRVWFMETPVVLYRWKVGITVLVVLLLQAGLYNQTRAYNAERIHDIKCTQAEARANLRSALFSITTLSPVFGHSSTVDLYEASMHTIIDNMLKPVVVDNCPKVR